MAKLVLFRCPRFPLDDIAKVVEVDAIDRVVGELDSDKPVVVLIGPRVPETLARAAVDAASSKGACFLRVREGDTAAWLKRLVRFALTRR